MSEHETLMATALPGCVKRIIINETDQKVGLYNTQQLGFLQGLLSSVLKDAAGPWVTVCEQHYQLASHATESEALGKLLVPSLWCKSCASASAALTAASAWKTQ